MTQLEPDQVQSTAASVLIVEDDTGVARHLARTTAAWGATAVVAATIGAAWKRIAERAAWMAIIVDVGMPDGSGMEMVARLRRRKRDEPVLVLTGLLDSQIVSATFTLDADYLVKPFERPLVERFLRRALRSGARHERAVAKQASPQVPDALQPLVDEVLRWGEQREAAEIQYVVSMARLARAVREQDDVTMCTCSDAAGVSRQTLEEYAQLTLFFPPDELEHLLALQDRHGRAVTRTHLLRLAHAPAYERQEFVRRAYQPDFDLRSFSSLARSQRPA